MQRFVTAQSFDSVREQPLRWLLPPAVSHPRHCRSSSSHWQKRRPRALRPRPLCLRSQTIVIVRARWCCEQCENACAIQFMLGSKRNALRWRAKRATSACQRLPKRFERMSPAADAFVDVADVVAAAFFTPPQKNAALRDVAGVACLAASAICCLQRNWSSVARAYASRRVFQSVM